MLRSAISSAAVAAVCLAPAACSKPAVPTGGACPGCNVVLISLDTVRADHLGAYGNDRRVSPNFDRLAAKSAVFERAISQTAWTLPGHGSMMTGLYPKRLGVERYPPTRRLPDVPMLAEKFSAAGYTTAAFTGGGFVSDHWGFGRGFEVYSSDGRRFEHNIDEGLDWLRTNAKRRFFLFLHGYDAHRPYFSTAEDKQAIGFSAKRSAELTGFCGRENRDKPGPEALKTILKFYDAAIHHGDAALGRYLDAFEELNLMENTVILVTADHGEEFFEHGNCDHVRFLYKEVVGVPFAIYVPGMTPKGRRINELVPASISVAPTLLDLVGVEHDMPGTSVVPVLNDERGVFPGVYSQTDSVLGKLGSRGATIALTTPTGKLISYIEEGTDEAYNTAQDPGEQRVLPENNDAYDRRKTLRAWNDALVRLPKPSGSWVVPDDESEREEREPATRPGAQRPDGAKKAGVAKPGQAAKPEPGKPAGEKRGAAKPGAAAKSGETKGRVAKPAPGRAPQPAPENDEDAEEIPEEIRKQLESLGYLE